MDKVLKNKFIPNWLKIFNMSFNDVIKLEKILSRINNKIPQFKGCLWEPFLYSSPFDIKVIILGQSPYPKIGDANGLAFDINPSSRTLPPSLQNIIKKLLQEYNIIEEVVFLSLKNWAKQGVLLLNIIPFLFKNTSEIENVVLKKWSIILNRLIKLYDGLPMICWGNVAKDFLQSKVKHKESIIFGVHPSPLSAYRGFFNKNYFVKANSRLESLGFEKIDWLQCVNIK